MKFLKAYLSEIVISILFVMCILVYTNTKAITKHNEEESDFKTGWTIIQDDTSTTYSYLPTKIKNKTGGSISYQNYLPDTLENGDGLLFFTNNQSVQVYINEEKVYDFSVPETTNSKTPGNSWHTIALNESNRGGIIQVVLTPSYHSTVSYVPQFQYGQMDTLIFQQMKDSFFSVFLAIVLAIFGIITIVISIGFKRPLHLSPSFLWLGIFLVIMSIWSILDSSVLTFFVNNKIILSQSTFLCLKLMFIPIIMYIRELYDTKISRILDIICYLSIADFVITSLLQIFGIADFNETIIVTHVLIIVSFIGICVGNVLNLVKNRVNKTVKVKIISTVLISMFVCIDLMSFYVQYTNRIASIIRAGLIVYIVVLVYMALNSSMKLIDNNEKLNDIEELSRHDPTTQLGNRKAFQEDMDEIYKKQSDYGVAVFDLNNLKLVNDLYGHSIGDYYIIISSEVIQDVFGKYGKVYRIGGDEFCAIVHGMTYDVFSDLEKKMSARMDGLNGMFFEQKMSIASGFATLDKNTDVSSHDTFNRADFDMYIRKKKMKGNDAVRDKGIEGNNIFAS